LLEPNNYFNTGTGYVRTRPDAARMVIHSNLADWHAASAPFDVIVTKNCIHHFKNLSQSAAAIRQKMHKNALWFSFREWFADSSNELYTLIATHPFCQRYGLYEWPYPAHHYAESIEIAGFELAAVVPGGYANNWLSCFAEESFSAAVPTEMAAPGLAPQDRVRRPRARDGRKRSRFARNRGKPV
jgi:hypothetical protein